MGRAPLPTRWTPSTAASALVRGPAALRGLLLVVLALGACLVAGTVVADRWAARIDAYAESVATNGGPSIQLLADVRDGARVIERRIVLADDVPDDDDRASVRAVREHVDRDLAAYDAIRTYPGEEVLFDLARRRLEQFRVATEAALAATSPAEHAARITATVGAADELQEALGALVTLNAREIADASHAIERVRRRSTLTGNLLRLATFLLALAGVALAMRGARGYVALVEERNRLVEARASELEARASELDLFAGRVAHDLRTPLTGIAMSASAAAAHAGTVDELRALHARVHRQTQRMAEIIDGLLAFAQAGARPQRDARAEIRPVVEDVVADVRTVAAGSDVEIVVEPLPASTVACPSSVLAVILSNLVRNATKYVGAGSGGVRRVTVRAGARDARVRIEVEDTGPGLPIGTEARVFEPFARFGGAHDGGVGLGLATVKRLVEAYGGEVDVDSRPGQGSRFWFELPAAA